MHDTIRYYDDHAESFVRETRDVDLSHIQLPFVQLLPAGGLLLDAGCGSGRDTAAFLRMGFRVVALDASSAMIEATTQTLEPLPADVRARAQIVQATFDQFSLPDGVLLDGIWANASLLHVDRRELTGLMRRLASMLAPGGVFFTSFKYGDGEEVRKGRYFNGYDEASFAALVAGIPELTLLSREITYDSRPGRGSERWITAILRRAGA